MSAPVRHSGLAARLITAEEWKEHRLEALKLAPEMFAGAKSIGDVLLSYQKKLLTTTAHNAVTIVEKSRRTGVTWAAGADAVLTSAAARDARGMDTLYIGYNLDMAREFIDTCAMWARAFNQATTDGGVEEFMFDDGEIDKNIRAFRIRFASGFEIVALASRPRSLRGRQGYVIIDEAAFHDDLEELIKAAIALLIWGGKVLIISTHNGESNYYNTLLNDARAGRKPYAILRVDFDEALHQGLYQRIAEVKGEVWSVEKEADWRSEIIAFYGDGADEELFCIPAQSGGAWLPLPLIEARSQKDILVLRLQRPDEFTHWPEHLRRVDIRDWCERELLPILKNLDPAIAHYLGGDIARVSDLTVYWPLARQRTTRVTTPFVIELRNLPFDAQFQILCYVLDRLPRLSGAGLDATGLGSAMAEQAAQKYGRIDEETLLVEEVKFSQSWYLQNMPPLKAAFEDNMIVIPLDTEIQSDLRLVEVRNGIARVPDLRSGEHKNRHGDATVALALAFAASRRRAIAYDYTSLDDLRETHFHDDDVLPRRGLW